MWISAKRRLYGTRCINRVRNLTHLAVAYPLSPWRRILSMDRNPIIIGGAARSGTTLLLSVLSCHEALLAIPVETRALAPAAFTKGDSTAPLNVYKIYYQLARRRLPAERLRWVEKTPKNVVFFQAILDYFGDEARLLHIIRDGRDVVTSRHPRDPDRFFVSPERWASDVEAGLHFRDHPQVLTLHYEELVQNYEKTMRSVCSFVDETFDEAIRRYPDAASLSRSEAWFVDARPISTESVGRWRRPEFAKPVQEFYKHSLAVSLLEKLGYK